MITTGSPVRLSPPGPAEATWRIKYLVFCAVILVTSAFSSATATLKPTATPKPAATPATASPLTWCTDKATMDVLGDSGSTGYGVIDPNNSWVAKLRSAKPGTRVNTYVQNGAMVSDFLPGGRWSETTSALRSIAHDQPSLVLIELGGNEYFHDLDPAQYQQDLERLTSAIWSVSPRSTLLYESIWAFDPRQSATARHTWNEYASTMMTVALNHKAGWIDLRPLFPARYADDAHSHLLNTDEIHPTDAGNAVEFAAISSVLSRC